MLYNYVLNVDNSHYQECVVKKHHESKTMNTKGLL